MRAGDVCYATCNVDYVGLPSATCTPDLTWGLVQGACYPGECLTRILFNGMRFIATG